MTNTFILGVALVILTCSINVVQNSSNFEAKVDEYLKEALKCHNKNTGMVISVVKDGKVLMSKGYGYRDTSMKEPMNDRTLLGIASMSKAFCTAVLVKLLARNASQSLFTRLTDILPNLQFSTKERTEYGNILDLLTHGMGMAPHTILRLHPSLTRKDIIQRAKKLQPINPFRQSYQYNNIMYGLVTALVEKLGGKSFEELVSEEMYKPLGMTRSNFMTKVDFSDNVATGYATDGTTGELVPISPVLQRRWGTLGASNNCMSCARDMSKWMLFHLNKGRNQHGQQILTEDQIKMLHKRWHIILGSRIENQFSQPDVPVSTSETNYALAWKCAVYRGYKLLHHSGTTCGYAGFITLIPSMNIGIFTSMNGADDHHTIRILFHNYIADLLLGEEPWLNKTTVCTFPEPWYRPPLPTKNNSIDKNIKPTRSLVSYVGVYHNELYGYLHVFTNTTTNTLQINYGDGSWLIYPTHTPDIFVGLGNNIINKRLYQDRIAFHHATNGRYTIDRVEMTTFELNQPPSFTKISSHISEGGNEADSCESNDKSSEEDSCH